ncbi:MAG: fatty acid desaturase family protein [Bacteroidetes bacterium]|nr:fatty acid desaturase family protein [Bacteroidota bacterium]
MKKNDALDLNLSLNPAELKKLYRIQSYKHGAAIAFNWIVIALTIWLCVTYFNPFLYILAIIIIGARQHALAILMHDATHYRFLKNKKWNDIMTNVLTTYFLFTSIEKYRQNHLRHHRHLNTEDDPDWIAKLGRQEFTFPKTKKEFLITLLSYFSLYMGVRDAIWIIHRFSVPKGDKKVFHQAENTPLKITFYVTLAILLTVLGLWSTFFFYWIIPYFSTFFMFQYIRSVAEHFGDLEYDDLLGSTRTVIKINPIERFFLAPHNVGYHLEHHLYPAVPFYHLPSLHKQLMANEPYAENAHLTSGYIGGLLNELSR